MQLDFVNPLANNTLKELICDLLCNCTQHNAGQPTAKPKDFSTRQAQPWSRIESFLSQPSVQHRLLVHISLRIGLLPAVFARQNHDFPNSAYMP